MNRLEYFKEVLVSSKDVGIYLNNMNYKNFSFNGSYEVVDKWSKFIFNGN